jgi:hypothetical protein
MTAGAPPSDFAEVCPFCGLGFLGNPNQCKRCGTLLGAAAGDMKRLVKAERRLVRSRKALADTLFLVGLLLGGPMMSIGGNVRIGLFVVLAGGIASLLRRYTDWSLPGTLVVGTSLALIGASWLVDAEPPSEEDTAALEAARGAYIEALAAADRDLIVESRGVGHVAVWFTLPDAVGLECGSYPEPEVRAHLGELGFFRIVVTQPNQGGGICSFRP